MQERPGIITFKGNPMTLLGPALAAGDKAPAFTAVDTGLAPVSLADFAGKIKIISAVPSSTRRSATRRPAASTRRRRRSPTASFSSP